MNDATRLHYHSRMQSALDCLAAGSLDLALGFVTLALKNANRLGADYKRQCFRIINWLRAALREGK